MKNILPKKIYLEITTRCNMHCSMCVKHTDGSSIAEKDMHPDVFTRLLDSLPKVESLILNGIGEPLLHPRIFEMVKSARACMADNASIGFQTNGILLDEHYALRLIAAGLDTLCLSVDGLEHSLPGHHSPKDHCFSAVAKAVSSLRRVKRRVGNSIRIGLETVLTRKNIHQLPDLVAWAATQGIDYIITTNLILYSKASEELNLFNPNSRQAIQLFQKYKHRALSQGFNLEDCFRLHRRYAGTRSAQPATDLLADMQREARQKDIRLNLSGLLEHDRLNVDNVAALFRKALSIAESHDIDLFIPPLQALDQRSCPFIENEAAFIAPNGDVMPCHFLWHNYSCVVLGDDIQVQERVFGNILQNSLESIWQSREYEEFRMEAGQYEYSSCWSCSQGPCSNLVNDYAAYANDCFGSQVPCGHCQWSLGGIRCL
ncbi:MAG: radical SAM/SPASM family putative metalloenzyme maturase [Desulforhopalus sp.]